MVPSLNRLIQSYMWLKRRLWFPDPPLAVSNDKSITLRSESIRGALPGGRLHQLELFLSGYLHIYNGIIIKVLKSYLHFYSSIYNK